MDNRLTPEQKDELIENTLRELPLAPLPRDLTADVMAQVKVTPLLRFRLTWSDFALSLVIALCILAVWTGFLSLPPLAVLQLRIQAILLWQRFLVNASWLVPALSITLGFGLGFLALANFRKTRHA